MKKVSDFIEKNLKWIAVALCGTLLLIKFIVMIGGFVEFPSAGGIITDLVEFGIVASFMGVILLCLFTNKKAELKIAVSAYLIYFVLSTSLHFSNSAMYAGTKDGLLVFFEILNIMTALLIVAVLAIQFMGLFLPKLNLPKHLALAALCGYQCMSLILFIFRMIILGKMGAIWYSFINAFSTYIFLPCALIVMYFVVAETNLEAVLATLKKPAASAEKAEEPKAEEAKEEPKAEEKAEEPKAE